MIKTSGLIMEEIAEYNSPKDKLARLVDNGEYIPIKRGLYEDNKNVSPHLLASSIYSPSYISFEWALSYHALISERVNVVTSATFDKKKKKVFETPFGIFSYKDVPSQVFYWGVKIIHEGEYAYRIASAEKAICDKLYDISPVLTQKAMRVLLEDDLRIDMDALLSLNLEDIKFLASKYRSTNVRLLAALLRRLSK